MDTSPSARLGLPNSPETKNSTEEPFNGKVSFNSALGFSLRLERNTTFPPLLLDLLLSDITSASFNPALSVSLILQGDGVHVTYRAFRSPLLLICSSISIKHSNQKNG